MTNDKLTQIFEMQAKLDTRIIDERGIQKTMSEWVIGTTIAMESEIDEIRREVDWKWWKNPQGIDEERLARLQGEVIDMWHFLPSLSLKVGLTADDVHRLYMEKNAENHARQDGTSEKEGYGVKESYDKAVEQNGEALERLAKSDDDDYETIICEICDEEKDVEKGTWALDKCMCEPCYAKYQG